MKKLLDWYKKGKENKYVDVNLGFIEFFIDFRKWFFCIKNGQLSEYWFCENELEDEEMSGEPSIDENGNTYRFIPIAKYFRITYRWHNLIRDHRFKIGLTLGFIIGILVMI